MNDINLVSYLPPFLQEYKEIVETLKAENPEFIISWNAAERVLNNEFISTADEFGIKRFEQMLNALPSKGESLETRRARIQNRWFNNIPYTMKAFIEKLKMLCKETDFMIIKDFDYYRIFIKTNLELYGQVAELENILNTIFPCNIVIITDNEIQCSATGNALTASGVVKTDLISINNDFKEIMKSNGTAFAASGVVHVQFIEI